MKLSHEDIIRDKVKWEEAGFRLPQFDIQEVCMKTKKSPVWVHFGAGNIFRAFQAQVVQELLDKKVMDRGIIAAEGYDYEIIDKIYHPHDNLGILVTFKNDGSVDKTVIGSVAESLCLDSGKEDFNRLKEIFKSRSLQLASFTITEKGYSLVDGTGHTLTDVAHDMENGPAKPISYLGKVTALLYARYEAGGSPIAMVSMDNCSHNGDRLYEAVHAFAAYWREKGIIAEGFKEYVENSNKVSFPWTMIDKITPRPDDKVRAILEACGVEEIEPIITDKNTYVAPFVNAEECQYLIIEDSFPNGRPKFTDAVHEGEAAQDKKVHLGNGIIFTTRDTVDKVEKMKVCTCLNPLHTALAIFGCLLGHELISQEMNVPCLRELARTIGYDEGLPVVVNPGVIEPKYFLDEVINTRIPNPFMPDSPKRIATDTSQKMAIRFGETVKAYLNKDNNLNITDLKGIPIVYAGWLRYLMGINDKGEKLTLSPDPMLDNLCPYVKDIKFGDKDIHCKVEPILSNEKIFGINLYEAGLGEIVEQYFIEMIEGAGAVLETLNRAMYEK